MNVLAYLIFGAIAGSVANYIDPHPSRGGLLGSMLLGIIGAFVGGYLGSMLGVGGVTGFDLTSFLLAIGGSLIMLWVGRMFLRAA